MGVDEPALVSAKIVRNAQLVWGIKLLEFKNQSMSFSF